MASEMSQHDQPANGQERLLQDFPFTSYEEWRQAAEQMLKGAPFEKKLVTRTYEGINVQPIYWPDHAEGLDHLNSFPGFPPYVRGAAVAGYQERPWDVAQELPYGTAEAWNRAARYDLERGQTAINLALDVAARQGRDPDQAAVGDVGACGLSLAALADLATALEGVDLNSVPINIQAGTAALPVVGMLVALSQQRGMSLEALHGAIEMDPLGALALDGALPLALETAYDEMARLTDWAITNTPDLSSIAVHSDVYADGGGNAIQELAFALATGVEYLRALQARGLNVNAVAPRMRFTFTVSANFFMEIAKLRAARLLWSQAVEAFGGDADAQRMTMHVRTANWNKTTLDPYVNMLRATVEAFAGVAGGSGSLHVGAFDKALRAPDEFARRIARNTQLILKQEAHLDKVIDPAGGSYYVESLTDELARKAWALFQEIESQGGMFQALQAGTPQQLVAGVAEQRAAGLSARKDVLVGTNMYAHLNEPKLESQPLDYAAVQRERAAQVVQQRAAVDPEAHAATLTQVRQSSEEPVAALAAAALAGATLGEIVAALRTNAATGPTATPVRAYRAAEPFEALRAAAEAYRQSTGARPQAFLVNMGPIPQHKARADFSAGFLQIGGFEIISNAGFATADEAARAVIESAAPVAVICSTDDTYPELVPPLVQQIKAARPNTVIVLAGYPADQVEAHKAAGVDVFIHLRANLYQTLDQLLRKIGVIA